jgi:hypothetical protein
MFVRLSLAIIVAILIGIVSGYYGGALLSVEQQFESSVMSVGSPLGEIVRRKPELYPEFLEAYRAERNGDKLAADGRRAELLQSLLVTNFKHADDQAVVTYAKFYLDYLETINSRNSMDCFYSVFSKEGKAGNSMISVLGESDSLPKLNELQASIVASALRKPQAVPDPKVAQPLVSKIATSIDVAHQRFFVRLNSKGLRREDQEIGCRAQLAFYQNILALPQKEASLVLRFLLF